MVVSPTQVEAAHPSAASPSSAPREASSSVMLASSGGGDSESGERTDAQFKASVLVVDDDPDVLRGVVRLLRSQGYSVTSAMNGADAARSVHGRSFDVIVSDIKMPGMDGIQLLREVREHDLHVPVVLVTGEPAVSTAVQALEYGAFHYLTKPADPEAPHTTVQKAG